MAATNLESPLLPYQHQVAFWYFIQNQTAAETRQSLIATFPEVAALGPGAITENNLNHISDLNCYPSIRTIERLLHSTGYRKNASEYELAANHPLCERMRVLFYEFGLNDSEMANFLQREGYQLSDRL